jgi:hypothetical protein
MTPVPHIGFSADLIFSASAQQVIRIEKVLSVDLVVPPHAAERSLPPAPQ